MGEHRPKGQSAREYLEANGWELVAVSRNSDAERYVYAADEMRVTYFIDEETDNMYGAIWVSTCERPDDWLASVSVHTDCLTASIEAAVAHARGVLARMRS